ASVRVVTPARFLLVEHVQPCAQPAQQFRDHSTPSWQAYRRSQLSLAASAASHRCWWRSKEFVLPRRLYALEPGFSECQRLLKLPEEWRGGGGVLHEQKHSHREPSQ